MGITLHLGFDDFFPKGTELCAGLIKKQKGMISRKSAPLLSNAALLESFRPVQTPAGEENLSITA